MSESIEAMYDILKLAKDVRKNKSIILDTGVYAHLDREDRDDLSLHDDIITVENKNGISLDDIYQAVEKIRDQFRAIDEKDIGRAYFYEGIIYHSQNNTYKLIWGS